MCSPPSTAGSPSHLLRTWLSPSCCLNAPSSLVTMVTGNRVCFPQPDYAVFPGFGGLYLRRHKVCCVARSHEQSVFCSQLLGKPKVTDADRFGVSRLVHVQDVTGFQVPMNNLEGRKQQSRQSGREKEHMRETRATWN